MINEVHIFGKNPHMFGRLELRCPPLPHTLMKAMELIDQPERQDVGQFIDMIQRDPVVVARLLHIVNSSYYGLRNSISSAERAVAMLGPVAVAGIVVGMNMLKLQKSSDNSCESCFLHLIRHSIATAFLTRHILEGPPRDRTLNSGNNLDRVGVGFTAGLLHDFGKIILVYNFPAEAAAFYRQKTLNMHVNDPDALHLEQLLFGFDHTEAGELVSRKLNFPDLLVDVIRFHHETSPPDGSSETDQVIRAVMAANLAAKAMGFASTKASHWDNVRKHPVWNAILKHDRLEVDGVTSFVSEIQTQRENIEAYIQYLQSNPASSVL